MTSPLASTAIPAHRIAVLVLDHALPLEIGMPFVVFGAPQLPYDVLLCAREPGPVATDHGWPIIIEQGLDALSTADTVIIPAYRDFLEPVPDAVIAALRAAHARGARIASICTGAFALAAAGLLDGRRATTHWYHADELARRCPTAQIDPDVLYVDSGDILTSAGVVSGIDLCLHLLRTDHGAAIANDIARTIVAAPYR
ncbi:AraC family transcriptional regulator, partial [Microbacterium gubbeenense]|uniref:AraC family transcriptional regulator n=1 Tax=Microbacterium gubbeenense TaxID=159896 RepID=UPI003F999BE6